MDNDRLKHSIAVARKMVEIGKSKNFNDIELQDLFLLGYNHDIGYEFAKENVNHGVIGGNILKNNGYKYWQEVYYHGEIDIDYKSKYLNILNQADMQIDKYGNDVGYEKRLADIRNRYGEDSQMFKKCEQLINNLKETSSIYEE